jgi:SAM-dependent methyltransferase
MWSTARRRGEEMAWADGYVVDTPYFEPINLDVCPAWLSMVSVLHGQPPIDMTRPFTWIDLGCGTGLGATMVAATNPNACVWGCDLNPVHVERARSLVRRAGIDNCTFDEASFEAVASNPQIGPSEADVIVIQGVYSWVSPTNRRQIGAIIEQRLKPGGVVYVMYEASPGWCSMMPLAEALRLQVEVDHRRSDMAFRAAAEKIIALADGGARYFPLPPREEIEYASWATADGFYAAHEYLGAHFGPLMFDDVARAMQSVHCSFVGSTEITDAMSAYWAPPALADLVVSEQDAVLQQMLRDLITMRALRRDLFRRGVAATNTLQVETWKRELLVVGTGKDFDDAPIDVPVGGIALDRTLYEPLVASLDEQPLDAEAVRSLFPDWSLDNAVNAMALLVAGGYALPGVREWEDTGAATRARALNEVLIAENRAGGNHQNLAAAATGYAARSDFLEMLAIGAVWSGNGDDERQLSAQVIDDLTRQDRELRREGRLVSNPDERQLLVEERVSAALDHLRGTLLRLGMTD